MTTVGRPATMMVSGCPPPLDSQTRTPYLSFLSFSNISVSGFAPPDHNLVYSRQYENRCQTDEKTAYSPYFVKHGCEKARQHCGNPPDCQGFNSPVVEGHPSFILISDPSCHYPPGL